MTTLPVMMITGTRKGIGRELALHYLEAGWEVVGSSRGDASLESDRYHHFCLDISDEPPVREMFVRTRKRFGRLDALVNNAGVASMNHALLTPIETVRRIIETNITGTFLCCREAGKIMRRQGGGRIVNLGSVAVPLALEGEAVYAASKAAVVTLTRVLAREFGADGITVNVVGPGSVRTDLTASVPEDKIARLLERQALPRYTEHAEIANVIDFFLRPESKSITGQVLYLGGV